MGIHVSKVFNFPLFPNAPRARVKTSGKRQKPATPDIVLRDLTDDDAPDYGVPLITKLWRALPKDRASRPPFSLFRFLRVDTPRIELRDLTDD